MSLFLEEVAHAYKEELYWLAKRVALNRERAGVHYRSDSEAGEFIATRCKAKIMAHCNDIKGLFTKAAGEWS